MMKKPALHRAGFFLHQQTYEIVIKMSEISIGNPLAIFANDFEERILIKKKCMTKLVLAQRQLKGQLDKVFTTSKIGKFSWLNLIHTFSR